MNNNFRLNYIINTKLWYYLTTSTVQVLYYLSYSTGADLGLLKGGWLMAKPEPSRMPGACPWKYFSSWVFEVAFAAF